MRFNYLYEIKNNINGRIYVGVHSTFDLEDGYMGSGKVILSAIEKYGVDNFTKTILKFFDSSEEMFLEEKKVVNEDFLKRPEVYNIKLGGDGGFDHLNNSSEEHINRTRRGYQKSIAKMDLSEHSKRIHDRTRKEKRGLYAEDYVPAWKRNPELQQLGNTPEARKKAKKTQIQIFAKIDHQQGEKNSQFGTCWISHDQIGSKKCNTNLLPEYLEQGWVKGRNKF